MWTSFGGWLFCLPYVNCYWDVFDYRSSQCAKLGMYLGISFATGRNISDNSSCRKLVKFPISYNMKDEFGFSHVNMNPKIVTRKKPQCQARIFTVCMCIWLCLWSLVKFVVQVVSPFFSTFWCVKFEIIFRIKFVRILCNYYLLIFYTLISILYFQHSHIWNLMIQAYYNRIVAAKMS